MKTLLTLLLLSIASAANASGYQEYFDCGNGVVPIIGGWHGKMWLAVEENHKSIVEHLGFFDAGIEHSFDKEKPQPLNADKNDFRFRIKLNARTAILRFHRDVETGDDRVSLSGRACRFMGDGYADEVKKYNGEEK